MTDTRKLTQAELLAEARARFGNNPLDWAFRCPMCGDVATGNDFSKALADNPRTHRDGSPVGASDVIGQECIGRTLGALKGEGSRGEASRGCDWSAFGLFRGPWEIVMPDGRSAWGFPLAEPTLPTWEQMTDLDKGAALLHLAKCANEGTEYAVEHYPAAYFDHPALTALDNKAASAHAQSLFEDDDDAWNTLGGDEHERLYDLALAADRNRNQTKAGGDATC